jgi:hypothetical protein
VLTQAAGMAGRDTRVRREGTGWGVGVARYSGVEGYCAAVAELRMAGVAMNTSVLGRALVDPAIEPGAARAILDQNAAALLGIG